MIDGDAAPPHGATATTQQGQNAVATGMAPDDRDFERATRGRIAPPSAATIDHEAGHPVWDFAAWDFLTGDPPATVNPSLWRQSRLNSIAGLFEVTDGIYQVRGFDLANITLVAGETGWLVIDPLTSSETARAALDLADEHLGARPVSAVIYTHSHVDHFAGIRGVVTDERVADGSVPIIAPAGFLEAAISENVIAGNAMTRRGTYMYGALLPNGPRGSVGAGLGQAVPFLASSGLIEPTVDIDTTGTEMTIDGISLVFQSTPGTEAPAEMNFHFPDHRALCMAENCTATLHNVYTPRGAQIRDALAWSTYIDEAIELFAADSDLVFASHHWPRWGDDDVRHYLASQRDLYRYIHDQTMRLANHGHTATEIAEQLALPASLGDEYFNRDYYGTVSHNAKAVYQRYLGWFDGVPAHLNPHPPTAGGERYVRYMGGADAVVEQALVDFEAGDYRWVAEVVNHVVFAEPDHAAAIELLADTYEQLGYQAESGPWRNFYLTGAQELRAGSPPFSGRNLIGADVVRAMTVEQLFRFLGVRLNGTEADGVTATLAVTITDRDETYTLGLAHSAVHHRPGRPDRADATLSLDHAQLAELAMGAADVAEHVEAGTLVIEGDRSLVEQFFALFDDFELFFPIVTP
jgi:alkyl sulfatase BDS1-like metallo-beta-lactamase superfamily hydrolase